MSTNTQKHVIDTPYVIALLLILAWVAQLFDLLAR